MNYRNGRRINVGDILWAKNARWIVTDDYQMKLIGKKNGVYPNDLASLC